MLFNVVDEIVSLIVLGTLVGWSSLVMLHIFISFEDGFSLSVAIEGKKNIITSVKIEPMTSSC